MSIKTKHYPILREYVRKVTEDLVTRGRIRRGYGQTIDAVIQQEVQTVIAEVAGDVRALAVELGVGAVFGGATLLESAVQQGVSEMVSAGARTLLEVLTAGTRSRT